MEIKKAKKTIKKALLLCGGRGTRLAPLTDSIQKALIPVNGKPILEHLVLLFKKYGVNEIYFAIGYLGEQVKEYFGDGSKFGIIARYIEENEPLGTAGCLRLARKEFASLFNEPFFMSNGDELKSLDLAEMEKFHAENKASVTIALLEVEDPSAYGVAKMDGNRISEFVEKPKKEEAPSNLINSGLYIIEPSVIDMIPEGFAMMEKEVFPKLAVQGKLFGYAFKGQWFDTGTFERLERAKKEWKGIN